MFRLRSTKFSSIGLDLGHGTLNAVQIKRDAAGWQVASSVSLARKSPGSPIDGAEMLRLQGVLDRRGFFGRNVVIAIPQRQVLTSVLELPARAPGVPIDQIAALEFARVHKKEPSAFTFSTWELPAPARASKATYMLAVGGSSDALASHINLVESEGLNVTAIQEPHSAAARGCLLTTHDMNGLVGIIDLGWSAVTLTIVLNDTIVYIRKLADAGMAVLCQQAAEVASIEMADAQGEIWRTGFDAELQASLESSDLPDALNSHMAAVIKDVSQAFSYASHRYSDSNVSKAILIGGGAAIPQINQQFESSLGVHCVIGKAGNASSIVTEPEPQLCSALGLALWEEALP